MIGGLLSSTVLTLVVLPTLYTVVEQRRQRRRDRRAGVARRPMPDGDDSTDTAADPDLQPAAAR